VGFVDMPSIGLDLPLDVRGTAFQHLRIGGAEEHGACPRKRMLLDWEAES
jgi:hypothetical protein